MSHHAAAPHPATVLPPNRHHLALMIWVAVFPTLTLFNLVFGQWLEALPTVVRTLILTTVAVPVVIYGLMPQLHRVRTRLLTGPAGR